jgi:methylase of polypeptide subunit release factors
MLRIPSVASVRALGRFLADSGYDAEHLGRQLDLADGLHPNLENLPVLLYKTEGDSALPVLARLFFVGWPSDLEACRRVIPDEYLNTCIEAGLVAQAGSQLEPLAVLRPFKNFVIACDAARLRGAQSDMTIGPSPSTRRIAGLAVQGSEESTLDIGTGTGVLALNAAAYSERVIATDVNERALDFAAFNAALNGVSNITFACGDAFSPIKGQRFSRIIANPPFFLAPSKKYVYSDSPLDLDGFTRKLAMEAPEHLEAGGFFQMICEWVQLTGQPWESRIREWVRDSGCDVLVLRGPLLTPLFYAEKRFNEAKLLHSSAPEKTFVDRMDYFKERKVEGIISGIITLRKRRGQNWFSAVETDPTGKSGEAIVERFETLDFSASHSEESLLRAKLRLADDVVLEERRTPSERGWEAKLRELSKTAGFEDRLRLDAPVAEALSLFDGQRTVGEVAGVVSESLHVPREEAETQCLKLARRLLQSSFVRPE